MRMKWHLRPARVLQFDGRCSYLPLLFQYVPFFGMAFLLILSLLCFQARPSYSLQSQWSSFSEKKQEQVVSGKTKSGAGGWMLISKRGFRTAWASRRWEKKEAAADYQFQNPVSELPGKEERMEEKRGRGKGGEGRAK